MTNNKQRYVVVDRGGATAPAFFETKKYADAYIKHLLGRWPTREFVRYRLVDEVTFVLDTGHITN